MDKQLHRFSVDMYCACFALCNFRIQTNLFYAGFNVCELDICSRDNCSVIAN